MTLRQNIQLTIDGREYIAVPREEFERLTGGAVDAATYARGVIGENLRAARHLAGMTQVDLAKKLGKSQSMIANAESGVMRVSVRYVESVLKACGLPEDWQPDKKAAKKRKAA